MYHAIGTRSLVAERENVGRISIFPTLPVALHAFVVALDGSAISARIPKDVHWPIDPVTGFSVDLVPNRSDASLAFCLGNAVKYAWRHSLKNGVEDLEKCLWYLRRSRDSQDKTRCFRLGLAHERELYQRIAKVLDHEPQLSPLAMILSALIKPVHLPHGRLHPDRIVERIEEIVREQKGSGR